MAIPVEKLKAFAGSSIPGMGSAPDEVAPDAGAELGGAEPDRFLALRPLLEQNAAQIEDMIIDLDTEVLTAMASGLMEETPPEILMTVGDQVGMLDQDLQDELKRSCAGGLSEDEAMGLADQLVSSSLLAGDPTQFAGWLLAAAEATAETDDSLEDDLGGAEDVDAAPALDDPAGLA